MTKGDSKPKRKSTAKKMRNAQIRAMAASGESTQEIADAFDLSRKAVSEILNDEESKRLVELGDTRLKLLMSKAIDALEWALDNKHEYGLSGASIKSAITILKNMGLAREKIDLAHSFPVPTVIRRKNGEEVILGAKRDGDGDEE